jgi:antitoxin (DNA-binding transcriptional repressor) of toxin-antitoxin stability system
MKNRTMNVTQFKAKCLSMLNELGERGGTITITKRGQPIAEIRPAHRLRRKSSEGILAGKGTVPEGLEKMDLFDLCEMSRMNRGGRRR